jgi:hypothetical protein
MAPVFILYLILCVDFLTECIYAAGKSNFMDAISFVMGEKTQILRVKRLGDLIHGASINKPVSRSAQVTAVFELEDGTEIRFTRLVQGSTSETKINGQVYATLPKSSTINGKLTKFIFFLNRELLIKHTLANWKSLVLMSRPKTFWFFKEL